MSHLPHPPPPPPPSLLDVHPIISIDKFSFKWILPLYPSSIDVWLISICINSRRAMASLSDRWNDAMIEYSSSSFFFSTSEHFITSPFLSKWMSKGFLLDKNHDVTSLVCSNTTKNDHYYLSWHNGDYTHTHFGTIHLSENFIWHILNLNECRNLSQLRPYFSYS